MGNFSRDEKPFFLENFYQIGQGTSSERGLYLCGGEALVLCQLGPFAMRIGISLPMHVIRNYVLEP
jgi:hypothetical protein